MFFAGAKSSVHIYVCARKDDGETSSPEPRNSALTPPIPQHVLSGLLTPSKAACPPRSALVTAMVRFRVPVTASHDRA